MAELYDLISDPDESDNLATAHPDRTAAMLEQLKSWYADTQATATAQPGGWNAE